MKIRRKLSGLQNLWRSKAEPVAISVVCLEARLSFDANFQVSYRDGSGNLRIKRIRSTSWSAEFEQELTETSALELKVFIYTPNLQSDQDLTLSIKIDGELQAQKNFNIAMDQDYAGWFTLCQFES